MRRSARAPYQHSRPRTSAAFNNTPSSSAPAPHKNVHLSDDDRDSNDVENQLDELADDDDLHRSLISGPASASTSNYGAGEPFTPGHVRGGGGSSSSSSSTSRVRTLTLSTAEQRKEEARQQRMNAEQRRRDQLRDGYDRLQAVIPHAKDKLSKVKLIECATQFIVDLTKRQEATQSRYEQLIKERDDLLRKNEELGSSLNGPSPSITSTFVTTEDGRHAAAAALASHPASSSDAQASSHVALPPTPLSIPPSGPSSGQPSSSSGPSSRSPVTGTGPPRRTRAQGAGVYAAAPRRDPTSTEAGSSNGHAEHDAEMSDGAS
ncbi:hypothetical protein DL93DRAFT_2162543 [Clavulina sp. PMI_390]|nr:hypothetical protein DL93DRAFT_2162543 [Clavulina sp. PMI_390]